MTETKVPILTQIQNELKVPKSQQNNFGHYKYRNIEDIEQALKPLLEKYGATLYVDEDVKQVGDRIYFVEQVNYKDKEQKVSVKGWAREALSKKGMDDSQLSGATSSYATKYALSKLFLIDDTRDADSQSNSQQSNTSRARKTYQRPATRKTTNSTSTSNKTVSDNDLLNYQITDTKGKVKLVQVIAEAVAGNVASQNTLGSLNGEDKRAYKMIYERGLYKSWLK